MNKHTEQEIHDLCFKACTEINILERTPTYNQNPKAISAVDKLNQLRSICRKIAAECDEIELKIIEDDGQD